MIALAAGFLLSCALITVTVGIGTSRWWHARRHQDVLAPMTCDHCAREIWT